jgi:hypothetical protein
MELAMSTKTELLENLRQARASLTEVVERIDRNRTIYDPWTMKEILDHIAGWDDAIYESIYAHVNGKMPGTPAKLGIDHYNAQTVSTREALPFQHSIREWQASRAQLTTLLESIDESTYGETFIMPWGEPGTIYELLKIFSEHEQQHADDVRSLIDK